MKTKTKKSLGQIAFEAHHVTATEDAWNHICEFHKHVIKCWENSAKAVAREVKRRMKK